MRLMIAAWKRVISGGMRLCLQQAVDAVTDAQAVFLGLDVNIAGAFVGGFDEDLVDELDDRGFRGHLGRLAVVGLESLEQFDFLGALLHQRGDGLAADAEMRLDEPAQSRVGWPGRAELPVR